MNERFPYGQDANAYIDKAFEKIKETYPWATKDMFGKAYSYTIEEEEGKMVFVKYIKQSDDSVDRRVIGSDEDRFIKTIVRDNEWYIEKANPVKDIYELPIGGVDICGWTLERYEFRSHILGGYSSMIQAGNRSTGGSREFFIPPSFLEGTYEEFLAKYNDMVPGVFVLEKEWLENAQELKAFLGF